MFIENELNDDTINLTHIRYFYSGTELRIVNNEEVILLLIHFKFKDTVITWEFKTDDERDKTLQNIRENLTNKRGYAKV